MLVVPFLLDETGTMQQRILCVVATEADRSVALLY